MNAHGKGYANTILRRLFVLTLVCAMVMSMLPATASARSGDTYASEGDRAVEEAIAAAATAQAKDALVGSRFIKNGIQYEYVKNVYVDWTKVSTQSDLYTASYWNDGGNRLLIVFRDGHFLAGNDFTRQNKQVDGYDWMVQARQAHYMEQVTETDPVTGISTTEYKYPELVEAWNGSSFGDRFTTKTGMKTPYIEYADNDEDNSNMYRFHILLARDDDTKSAVALGREDKRLALTGIKDSVLWTFYIHNGGKVSIFQNQSWADDLTIYANTDGSWVRGKLFGSVGEMSRYDVYTGVNRTEYELIEVEQEVLDTDAAQQDPEKLGNIIDGSIEFYQWNRVKSYKDLPTDTNKTYRMMLVWGDRYYLEGDDWRECENGMGLYVNEHSTSGAACGNVSQHYEIDLGVDTFYTVGGMGTPYLHYKKNNTKDSNDKCPMYTIQLAGVDDKPSDKWIHDGDNKIFIMDKQGEDTEGSLWGIIVGNGGASTKNDAGVDKVKIFNDESSGYDTGFMCNGNCLYGDDDGSGWDYSSFTMYIGIPTVYPAVTKNYIVGADQTVRIAQNAAMYRNVTITVEKDGIFTIESWFMNNGSIIVDGGTLIVQNGGVLFPFVDVGDYSGKLEIRNGGELVILPGSRAAFGQLRATQGSSIVNRNMLMAETILLNRSVLDNRESGSVFAGYDFRQMNTFRYSEVIDSPQGDTMKYMKSRLKSDVTAIRVEELSAINNAGSVTYQTKIEQGSSGKTIGKGPYRNYKV